MCIAQDRRVHKTAPKAAIKLPATKHHELLAATSVGKAVHRGHDKMYSQDESSQQHLDANSATVIASPPYSPATNHTTDTAALASNNDIVNSIHEENEDKFDFDFSFLQIPTGGIINTPRRQGDEYDDGVNRPTHLTSTASFSAPHEATIPTHHIRIRPKPLDLSSLGIILKPKYRGIDQDQWQDGYPKLLPAVVPSAATLPPRCTTPSNDFLVGGTVTFKDFVYETPKQQMQRMVGLTTPPTTPRASGHVAFFVDYAKIPESLLLPMYH
jgi:hypothetical protein